MIDSYPQTCQKWHSGYTRANLCPPLIPPVKPYLWPFEIGTDVSRVWGAGGTQQRTTKIIPGVGAFRRPVVFPVSHIDDWSDAWRNGFRIRWTGWLITFHGSNTDSVDPQLQDEIPNLFFQHDQLHFLYPFDPLITALSPHFSSPSLFGSIHKRRCRWSANRLRSFWVPEIPRLAEPRKWYYTSDAGIESGLPWPPWCGANWPTAVRGVPL